MCLGSIHNNRYIWRWRPESLPCAVVSVRSRSCLADDLIHGRVERYWITEISRTNKDGITSCVRIGTESRAANDQPRPTGQTSLTWIHSCNIHLPVCTFPGSKDKYDQSIHLSNDASLLISEAFDQCKPFIISYP